MCIINIYQHVKFHDCITWINDIKLYLNIFLKRHSSVNLRSRSSKFSWMLCVSSTYIAIWSFSTIFLQKCNFDLHNCVCPWGQGHLYLVGCCAYHQYIHPYEVSVQCSFKNWNFDIKFYLNAFLKCDLEVKVI